tara:strand:+ start:748 stop:969 length:222 start_codon:yes stop_codon:yes gene_type:complete
MNISLKHLATSVEEDLRLKRLSGKETFIRLMFEENCKERLANNQEPYSCVEEYMNRNENFVIHLYRRKGGIFS